MSQRMDIWVVPGHREVVAKIGGADRTVAFQSDGTLRVVGPCGNLLYLSARGLARYGGVGASVGIHRDSAQANRIVEEDEGAEA